jgi:phage antirepressor YoqD-like protein
LGLARPVKLYTFEGDKGKRDSYVVVAQLSPEFTARLVDRWQELEAEKQQARIPQTLSEALRLAADQAEQIEEQQKTIEQQRPAVEFVESYVDSSGSVCIRDAGKTLGTGQKRLVQFMIDHGICYRLPTSSSSKTGDLRPYHRHEQAGRFEVRTGTHKGHAFTQTRITPKGLEWLARKASGELNE